mmetsp:Transcript_84014/g.102912  ORF Transcript_84014/g.102912 Transcript_84014/m.102912 type:complete len:353 (+) Transcript_84014:45-1103(+)
MSLSPLNSFKKIVKNEPEFKELEMTDLYLKSKNDGECKEFCDDNILVLKTNGKYISTSKNNINNNDEKTDKKGWSYDINKAMNLIKEYKKKQNNNEDIKENELINVKEWAKSTKNMDITEQELLQGLTQLNAYKQMDMPETKNDGSNAAESETKNDDAKEPEITDLTIEEQKMMIDMTDNEELKKLLTIYNNEYNHDPKDGKQLYNYLQLLKEQNKLNNINTAEITFDIINAEFKKYGEYVTALNAKNAKINEILIQNKKKETLTKKYRIKDENDFDKKCLQILDEYINQKGRKPTEKMFYNYITQEMQFNITFKKYKIIYDKALGIKSKPKKKGKIKHSRKKLKDLYKKNK